jgi:alanine racemase
MTRRRPPSEPGSGPDAVSAASFCGAWVSIDLAAIQANARLLTRRSAPAELLAVVKADAYGHGASAVASALEAVGVHWFAVANVDEGSELREAGIAGEILVLGPARSAECEAFREHRLTPVVSSLGELDLWEASAGASEVGLHLEVDTGMSRLGVGLDELPAALGRIRASERLRMAGFLSHLARSDEPESPFNTQQIEAFRGALVTLTAAERAASVVHLANSGGALHLADRGLLSLGCGLVRAGLALYGLDPARRAGDALTPALSVHARISQVRELPAGRPVGYSGTWTTRRASRLAVVPVGYADGYPLALSNQAEVLVAGRRVPLAGRVSMDMTVLDVTEIPAGGGADVGDPVVLLGHQGDGRIDAWELADRAGSIPWEILCGFKLRLPRRTAGLVRAPDPVR